jgi:uncharacterized OB-fold protein
MEYKLTFEQYQQGLAEDKFLGLRCNACQAVTFPPLAICRNCSGTDLKVTEIKGEGTLRTFTVIRVAPQGKKPPYVVAMVELNEGAWAIGNLVDINPDESSMDLIGKRVALGTQRVKDDVNPELDRQLLTFKLI